MTRDVAVLIAIYAVSAVASFVLIGLAMPWVAWLLGQFAAVLDALDAAGGVVRP